MKTFLLIYLIGFIYTYWVIKRTYKRRNWDTEWSDVFSRIVTSIFSWIGALSVLLINLAEGDYKINSKPPKWM